MICCISQSARRDEAQTYADCELYEKRDMFSVNM